MFGNVQRNILKDQVFRERSPFGTLRLKCELCHDHYATDLHEIWQRAFLPPGVLNAVPRELLSCLCNDCNVNVADMVWAQIELINLNVKRYGEDRVKTAVLDFEKQCGITAPFLFSARFGLWRTYPEDDIPY